MEEEAVLAEQQSPEEVVEQRLRSVIGPRLTDRSNSKQNRESTTVPEIRFDFDETLQVCYPTLIMKMTCISVGCPQSFIGIGEDFSKRSQNNS